MAKTLALEVAPLRVNVIAPGFGDAPLSATLLGGKLHRRREQLRTTLPILRVVGPADIGALVVHLMTNASYHRSNIRYRRWTATRGALIILPDETHT